jgi:hypothetical protein
VHGINSYHNTQLYLCLTAFLELHYRLLLPTKTNSHSFQSSKDFDEIIILYITQIFIKSFIKLTRVIRFNSH